MMGPVAQLVFVCLIYYSRLEVEPYFYSYHLFILFFNLLPIYPLDGGRLLYLFFSYLISYFQSLKVTLYFSAFLYFCFFFYILLFQNNLIYLLMAILLGFKLYKEVQLADYYFHKFLIERYFNNYSFSKIKNIDDIRRMQRDYYHYFVEHSSIIPEREKLYNYFI